MQGEWLCSSACVCGNYAASRTSTCKSWRAVSCHAADDIWSGLRWMHVAYVMLRLHVCIPQASCPNCICLRGWQAWSDNWNHAVLMRCVRCASQTGQLVCSPLMLPLKTPRAWRARLAVHLPPRPQPSRPLLTWSQMTQHASPTVSSCCQAVCESALAPVLSGVLTGSSCA